ncbi:MAG: hypothetical protein WA369_08640 [Candidatus Acidiferrales bacterium]
MKIGAIDGSVSISQEALASLENIYRVTPNGFLAEYEPGVVPAFFNNAAKTFTYIDSSAYPDSTGESTATCSLIDRVTNSIDAVFVEGEHEAGFVGKLAMSAWNFMAGTIGLNSPIDGFVSCSNNYFETLEVLNRILSKAFQVCTVAIDCIEETAKAFAGPREAKFIAHLVVVREIPQYLREATEATAKDHTTHLENIILTREHSDDSNDPIRSVIRIFPRSLQKWVRVGISFAPHFSRSSSRSLYTCGERSFGLGTHPIALFC